MEKIVIKPLKQSELANFLDDKAKDIIKYFIVKSLFSQPETKTDQRDLPIQIPKEHIEQWFTQALDVKPVGAGSYPVDIYNDREHWGADIKMLNIKVDGLGNVRNSESGEASLGQNFADAGINLDVLFSSKSYEEIKNKWVKLYQNKYGHLKKDYPFIKKIFYFFILRPGVQKAGASFYFAGAVLNLKNLKSIGVDMTRTTRNSVFLNNFISSDYGNTKIYKAKKRLELRIRPKKWVDNNKVIRITTSFNPSKVNLREKNVNEEYLQEQIKKIKKIKFNFEI